MRAYKNTLNMQSSKHDEYDDYPSDWRHIHSSSNNHLHDGGSAFAAMWGQTSEPLKHVAGNMAKEISHMMVDNQCDGGRIDLSTG